MGCNLVRISPGGTAETVLNHGGMVWSMPASASTFRSSISLEAAWWTRVGEKLYRPMSYSIIENSTIEARWLPLGDCFDLLRSNWRLMVSGTWIDF
jgi:hypothetical protein